MILTAIIIITLLFLFPLRKLFIARWRDIVPLAVGIFAGIKIIEKIPYHGHPVIRILGVIITAVLTVHIIRPMIEELFPEKGNRNGN